MFSLVIMTEPYASHDASEIELRTYTEKKGLTVNTAKSEVVHFNSKSVSPLQNPFTYNGVRGASREGQVQIFGHAA